MKNIFKSLMFVAVAAMTFTACEKENADNTNNNGAEQKTTITFNAKMADTDTRTYFGAYDEVNGYPTLLNNNEVAKFDHWSTASGNQELNDVTATINDGRFTVIFNQAINGGETIDAYLPASAWGNVNNNWNGSYTSCVVTRDYAFPMEQNPTTTSVDPAAHIFKATTTYNGEDNIDLYFEHQVAYGKMSLRNFAGADVEQYVLTINGETYVVNATWTTDVWFACEPVNVSEMSVSVVTANGTYTKSLAVSAVKTLNFVKGQVSTFGVNMDGVTPEETEVIEFDGTIKSWTWLGYNSTTWTYNYEINGDNFSFVLGQNNGNETYLFKRTNNDCILGNAGNSSKYFSITDFTDASISASTLTPTAGTLVINEGGGAANAGKIHDVTITLTINGEEYVYTYYGYINGEAVDNGGNEGGNEGGEEPAEPVQLATPENVKCAVSGANVTITWNAVTNASSYNVTLGEQTKNVNTATATFENVAAGTYNVTVVAVGTGNYTNSEAANATVTVEAAEEPIVYDPWACQKIGNYSGYPGNYTVTVQGTGSNTDTIVLSGLAVGNAPLNITATKEGVPGEGKGYIVDGEYRVVFDVTIGNVTYRGTTSNSII